MFYEMHINEQQSRDNARTLLKTYRRLARMAGRQLQAIPLPILSDMPHGTSSGKGLEKAITNTVTASQEVKIIDYTLSLLDKESQAILFYAYCSKSIYTLALIADKVGLANENAVDYLKRKALLEFAEAYPAGKLLEFM